MAGFENEVLLAKNVNFNAGTPPNLGQVTTNGQLLIGSTALPNIQVGTLTSPLGTLTIGYSSPNITIDLTGGASATEKFNVDVSSGTGTNPVLPNSGVITITGGQYSAATYGTRVCTLASLAANTISVLLQQSSAQAASTTTANGICHFNNTQFTVDSNGFVNLIGTAPAIEKVNVQTGTSPVVPTSGAITLNGATVSAGTNPVRTDGTNANTIAVEVQISQAIASTDATKIGLSNYNSAHFSVDANGFVSLIGGGFKWVDQTADLNPLVKETGYFADKAASRLVLTLPTGATMGDTIIVQGFGAQGWQLNAGTGQTITNGVFSSTVAGSVSSTQQYDSIELVCSPTTTTWLARNSIGNLTYA